MRVVRIYYSRILSVVLVCFSFLCFSSFSLYGQDIDANSRTVSDIAFAEGVQLYKSGDYAGAIPYFQKSAGIDTLLYKPEHPRSSYAQMWLASCYYKLGDISQAAYCHDAYMVPPIDRRLTVLSDSLSAIAIEMLYANGNAYAALPVLQRILEIEKQVVGEESFWVANTSAMCAYANMLLGNIDKALKLYKTSLRILSSLCGENSLPYGYVYCDLVNLWYNTGNAGSALEGAHKLLEIVRTSNKKNLAMEYYGHSILGEYHISTGNIVEAVTHLKAALKVLEANGEQQGPYYGINLFRLGACEQLSGNYDSAFVKLKEAYVILGNVRGLGNLNYLIECMSFLSQAAYATGDAAMAEKTAEEALSMFEIGGVEKNNLYPELHYLLYNYKYNSGNREEALLHAREAIDSYSSLDCGNYNYADILLKYAGNLSDNKDYRGAVSYAERAVDFIKRSPMAPDSLLLLGKSKLALHYSNQGVVDRAAEMANDVISRINGAFGAGSLWYVEILCDMAPVIYSGGERKKGCHIMDEALSYATTRCKNTKMHLKVLNSAANLANIDGRYTDAVKFQSDAVALTENLFGKQSREYSAAFASLINFSSITNDIYERQYIVESRGEGGTLEEKFIVAYMQGNYSQADSLADFMFESHEFKGLKNDMDKAMWLTYRAEVKFALAQFSQALELLEQVYHIYVSLFDKERVEKYYYKYWNMLGKTHLMLNNLSDAEKAYLKTLVSTKAFYGEYHIEHLLAQVMLANVKVRQGEVKGAQKLMVQVYEKLKGQIFTMFATMSSSERMAIWNQLSVLFDKWFPVLTYLDSNPAFTAVANDAVLFAKGLLLGTEQHVADLFRQSGDEEGKRLYRNLMDLKQKHDAGFYPDSLRQLIKETERELISRSTIYGDYTSKLQIGWREVQAALDLDEIAVEFVDFYDGENNIYAAYIITKEMDSPKMINLFDSDDMRKADPDNLYENTVLYNMIWRPLKPYMINKRVVWFSPSGILHNTAIESLKTPEGKVISDIYQIARLSSTRELVNRKTHTAAEVPHKGALYGGIEYNSSKESVARADRENGFRYAAKSLTSLEGTLDEVNSIYEIFAGKGYAVKKFTKDTASEASVKSLSSSDVTVLHIATHGFYFEQSADNDILELMMPQGGNVEDMSLARSGLYLAGAGMTLAYEDFGESAYDGILTAREVASLDLGSVELVNLSACETGLGDISSDGVFGLQRGFKKAGVKSIIMSLWKVDDDATCFLMTEFYRNWIAEGKSKYESLELAKKAVRLQVDKGWNDPKYWAAFILLDGLD